MSCGGISPIHCRFRRAAAGFRRVATDVSSDRAGRAKVAARGATPSSVFRCAPTGKVRYPSQGGRYELSVFVPSAFLVLNPACQGKMLALTRPFVVFGGEADKKTGAVSCNASHLRWRLSHLWALRPAATRLANRPSSAVPLASVQQPSPMAILPRVPSSALWAMWPTVRPRTTAAKGRRAAARLENSEKKPVGWTRREAPPPLLCLTSAVAAKGTR